VRRVHRTLLERLAYLAIYQCCLCEREQHLPRPFRLHFGPHARCPQCGTYRVTRLGEPDVVDAMQGGLFNMFERLSHGNLYHCRFCRVQFYDRRPLASEPPPEPEAMAGNTPA
jgi:DNA-directed RNA polymerase subunit RPC12/RpoP